MNLEELNQRIAQIESEAADAARGATAIDAVRGLETGVTGKKGPLGSLIAAIKDYPAAHRAQVGQPVEGAPERAAREVLRNPVSFRWGPALGLYSASGRTQRSF